MAATQFLRDRIEAVPYSVQTVLADDRVQFANCRRDVHALARIFGRVCRERGIEHRLTRTPPWANSRVERTTRTNVDAGVRRHRDDRHEALRGPLADFLAADTFARRLGTLGGLTP